MVSKTTPRSKAIGLESVRPGLIEGDIRMLVRWVRDKIMPFSLTIYFPYFPLSTQRYNDRWLEQSSNQKIKASPLNDGVQKTLACIPPSCTVKEPKGTRFLVHFFPESEI